MTKSELGLPNILQISFKLAIQLHESMWYNVRFMFIYLF